MDDIVVIEIDDILSMNPKPPSMQTIEPMQIRLHSKNPKQKMRLEILS
jgi:hypothetical protein